MKRRPPIVLSLLLLGGCSTTGTDLHRGKPMSDVHRAFGRPDVVSDQSGDTMRLYLPGAKQEYSWPKNAAHTYYYLERDLFVTFVLGMTEEWGPIPADLRERSLVPIVQRSTSQK